MVFVYPERLDPARDFWHYAGETGRIARSLATGQGFSSPLFANTGPTAWLGPIFPSLLALIFKLFGVYSRASLLTVLSIDCLFSALTCIPVYFLARRCFGSRAAVWGPWAWALFPYSIFFAADFVWATTLSTLLLTTLFALGVSLPTEKRLWPWIGFGLLYGFAALNDPVVLAVLPVLFIWTACERRKRGAWLLPAALATLAFFAVITPWSIRNYATFHKLIPIRGGLGLEFYCGNNADSWHWDPPGYHPSDNERDWQQYRTLGEVRFMQLKQSQAFDFINTHRALYVRQTLRRIIYFWTGYWSFDKRYLHEEPMDPYSIVMTSASTLLALIGLRKAFRQGRATGTLFALTFIFFPVVYYLTHTEDYYRRPIDALLVVLGVAAFVRLRPPVVSDLP
jgi:4-amino-4-deoxy-L-arabinose transferase-like glycosyltransferase